MPSSNRSLSPNAVPVRKIINKLLAPPDQNIVRHVLSGKASKQLQHVAKTTGIDINILADSAIQALHAALSGSTAPNVIRDRRLREYLNRNADSDR